MPGGYSVPDLLEFLVHAAEKGLMPTATAQALAVASRTVFSLLDESEKTDVRQVDLDALVRRFTNKRASDFSPSSLRDYGTRVHRAVELFVRWRDDPSRFTVKTRATKRAQGRKIAIPDGIPRDSKEQYRATPPVPIDSEGYQTSFPVRRGQIVTLLNIPSDLTAAEAERLAAFVKMLAARGE